MFNITLLSYLLYLSLVVYIFLGAHLTLSWLLETLFQDNYGDCQRVLRGRSGCRLISQSYLVSSIHVDLTLLSLKPSINGFSISLLELKKSLKWKAGVRWDTSVFQLLILTREYKLGQVRYMAIHRRAGSFYSYIIIDTWFKCLLYSCLIYGR